MNIPEELKYTEEHEWVRIEDNIAIVGITDFAQGELGDIVYLEIDTLDNQIDSNEVFGTVEAVKTVSDLYMPVSGKIIEVNDALDNNPDLLNQSPYNDGWIIKVQINDANNNELLNWLFFVIIPLLGAVCLALCRHTSDPWHDRSAIENLSDRSGWHS